MKKSYTLVADEAISKETCHQFRIFLQKHGYLHRKTCMIAHEYSGMPDGQIIRHLLNQETIFLTTDRPLHNTVLSQSLISYYVSHDMHFINTHLKDIRTKSFDATHANDRLVKETYHISQPIIRPFVLPTSEKSLKKLRTKRRRIRNHFDGYDHIDSLAVTVSWKAYGLATLFGVRLRISSNIGMPALDASERYIREAIFPEYRNQVAFNYALIVPIQFLLQGIKTQIYYDAPMMASPAEMFQPVENIRYFTLFKELSHAFPNIEFIPSVKGRFIERLRKKLNQLSMKDSNEIVSGNIEEIGRNVHAAYSEVRKNIVMKGQFPAGTDDNLQASPTEDPDAGKPHVRGCAGSAG